MVSQLFPEAKEKQINAPNTRLDTRSNSKLHRVDIAQFC
jgi:hypothetical protein